MPFRRSRFRRRRRVKADMLSVKWCRSPYVIHPTTLPPECGDPAIVSIILMQGLNADQITSPQSAIHPEDATSRRVLFLGLTGNITWAMNPANADEDYITATTMIAVWEAIWLGPMGETGLPLVTPRLTDPGLGVDNDVDILWKRIGHLPFFGPSVALSYPQLALTGQNVTDVIRIKTKRRLKEREALFYTACFVTGLADSVSGIPVSSDGWLRIAARVS